MQTQTLTSGPGTAAAAAVLDAGRFQLRPVRKSDAGLIRMYTADKRLAEMTTRIPHPLPPGATEAFIARVSAVDSAEQVWVMDGASRGLSEVLGIIGLKQMDRDQAEIGYWVAPAFWNTGYASQAVTALVQANPLGHATYFASVFQDNPGSARVLTNAGFEYIGDAETFSVARNGKVPTWTYLKKLP